LTGEASDAEGETLETTQLPLGSKNSSPTANPACGTVWQYATLAIDRNEPVSVAMVRRSFGFQRLLLRTRAPRELTFSVNVVSVPGTEGWPVI